MLKFALDISFICIAVHIILTWKGMLLKPVGDWLDLRVNKYLKKPLFTCLMCMASFWTLIYWWFWGLEFCDLTIYTMFVVCGINTLLSTIIYAFHEEPDDFDPITNETECLEYEQMVSDMIWESPYHLKKLTPEEKDRVRKIKGLLNDYYLEKFIETLI